MILMSLVRDSMAGAEISSLKLAQRLNQDFEVRQNVLNVKGPDLQDNCECYRSLLTALATDDICISTHRNIAHAQATAPNARHIVVFRGVPLEGRRVRVYNKDEGGLVWQSWSEIIGDIHPTTHVTSPSPALSMRLTKVLGRGVSCIPNIIDVPRSRAIARTPRFFVWARYAPWKRRDVVVNAFGEAGISNRLIINGQEWREPLGLLPHAWIPEPWRLASKGDVVLSGSLHEAFGRDVFEGMRRGCLVIAIAGTPISEIIEARGCGRVLSASSSVADYADAIRSLAVMDMPTRRRLGIVGSKEVRARCSPEVVVRQWQGLLADVL